MGFQAKITTGAATAALLLSACGGSAAPIANAPASSAAQASKPAGAPASPSAAAGRPAAAPVASVNAASSTGRSSAPKAYVGLFKDNSVGVIDTATQKVLTTIPVPAGPHGLVLTP